jgi:hypothetical protein
MVRKITEVQRPLAPIAPDFRLRSYWFARLYAGTFLRRTLRVRRVTGRNIETLLEMYRRFQEGGLRFIIAFRHPFNEDGPVQFFVWSRLVGAEARRRGVRLPDLSHAHFIYSRDVPLWAGAHVGRFFSRLAAVPLLFGKVDSEGLGTLRRYLVDGRFPVAMAPEAQVSYHCRRLPTLAPGAAQMGFWCQEGLLKAGRSEEVYVVPIGTCYRFLDREGRTLDRLLERTEEEAGLPPYRVEGRAPTDGTQVFRRLVRIEEHVLDRMEDFYSRFFGVRFEQPPAEGPRKGAEGPRKGAEGPRKGAEGLGRPHRTQRRIEAVAEAALSTAEGFFGLQGYGDFIQRVLTLRRAGLEWMYRDDIADISALSPLAKGLADRVAAESFLQLRHMELVDAIGYWRADYVSESSDFDRLCEYATNLYDYVARLKGGNISTRSNLFLKDVEATVGEPINVSRRWQEYQANRKRAVQDLTADISRAFEALIRTGCPDGPPFASRDIARNRR